MDITFSCPHCDQTLTVDEAGAGETVPCPSCNRDILVPLDLIDRTKAPVEPPPQLDGVRLTAKLTVEEHWRQFIALAHVDMAKALGKLRSFDATVNQMTEHMSVHDATIFRQIVEAERQKLADEYDRNPDALKARLGVSNSIPSYPHYGNRQTMGEMVARTAVRATIWESVWAIFRLFR